MTDESSRDPSKKDLATEFLARLLCEQDGHDPDGAAKNGFGWRNYSKRASELITAMMHAGIVPPTEDDSSEPSKLDLTDETDAKDTVAPSCDAYPASFANYPHSITERRAALPEGSADDWTVRDVLISTLRDLDSGLLSPTRIVIALAGDVDDPENTLDIYMKSPTREATLSLVHRTQLRLMQIAMEDS